MNLSRRELLAGSAATIALSGCSTVTTRGTITGLDYRQHDALSLAGLVSRGEVTPLELLEEAIARTQAQDGRLNFLAQEMFDYGRQKIAQGLPQGPFTGVPFLEKDLHMHIAGYPSGQGSRFYANYVPQFTSELVRRHEAAGLVIFGKTTTPEFGLTGTTESIAEGQTRNPWDLGRSSGGSSGGAATAVSAGVIPLAHASDGGGSIRIPASNTGLFGLKPSRGRVPMGPLRTEGWGGSSTNGAISRSVRDSAALLDATHGTELGSRYSAPTPSGTFLSQVTRDPGELRVALMLEPVSGAPIDPQVIAATRSAAQLCESLGHRVEEKSFQFDATRLAQANFAIVSTALAADLDARAAATGITLGPDVLEPVTLAFYGIGKQMTGTMVAEANVTTQEVAIEVARFMQEFDVILSPVLATPAPLLGVYSMDNPDFAAWGAAIGAYVPFPGLFNTTGQPSMSVPLSMSPDGLPIGAMFSGRYGDEATLLRLAGQLEQASPWFDRLPEGIS
ncbi:amidase [Erythrobacter alti]|uniref:amidase n=1 Tax=Erythrobacter alti TaxID=1896145 RepID=UPI0030F46A42